MGELDDERLNRVLDSEAEDELLDAPPLAREGQH